MGRRLCLAAWLLIGTGRRKSEEKKKWINYKQSDFLWSRGDEYSRTVGVGGQGEEGSEEEDREKERREEEGREEDVIEKGSEKYSSKEGSEEEVRRVEGREEEVIEEDSEKEGRLGRGEGTKVGK